MHSVVSCPHEMQTIIKNVHTLKMINDDNVEPVTIYIFINLLKTKLNFFNNSF